jgi:hypothetical protein
MYLHGSIFAPTRADRAQFCAVLLEGGTVAWENGADISRDVLFYNLTQASMRKRRSRARFWEGPSLG